MSELKSLPELPESSERIDFQPAHSVSQTEPQPSETTTAKKSPGKRALMFVLLLAVAGGGYWYFSRQGGGHGEDAGLSAGGGKAGGAAGGAKRAVQVTTAQVKRSDLPITVEAIGNVEASESVSVTPQISGLLKRVYFTQGQNVTKGQLLFEIDSRLQNAELSQTEALLSRSKASIKEARANLASASTQTAMAEANIRRDKAQLTFAKQEASRTKALLDKSLAAREEYDRAQTNVSAAEAALAADQAALANVRAQIQAEQAALQTAITSVGAEEATREAARIQLGFTKIYAPITGKTGPLLINAGNTVQANSSALVNIKQLSPILVNFTVPEKELPAFQKAMQRSGVSVSVKDKPAETGQLVFIDNMVNKNNGTVTLKARFGNLRQTLWPGQFLSLLARIGIDKDALSVPAEAIQKAPTGEDFVYIVQNDKAKVQNVTVERMGSGIAVISQGLKVNQEVVVTGQLALANDTPVKIAGAKP